MLSAIGPAIERSGLKELICVAPDGWIFVAGTLRLIKPAGDDRYVRCHSDFDKIRVEFPVRHSFKFGDPPLCEAGRLVGASTAANFDDSLDDFGWMPVRAQQILEETHSVARYRYNGPENNNNLA